jgi:EAL domain-containing protein (putative c-di-GMP-specific phosphodiesterase class I)
MARSLNLRVVAEGVETGDHLNFLRGQGCDVIQGEHYSRPLPPDEFESFARQYAGRRIPDEGLRSCLVG